MNSQTVIDICKNHGVHFVNRSHGMATTSTVTQEQMQSIMEDAVQNFLTAPNLPCAVCGEQSITTRYISINNGPLHLAKVCEIHADAADEDTPYFLP